MNSVEIKNQAKEMIKGNLWNIWKPYLLIILISYIVSFMISGIEGSFGELLAIIVEVALIPASIGFILYILKFVRRESYSINDLLVPYNNIWVILGVTLLSGLIIFCGYVFFIIPGIIFAFQYIMVNYILADGETGVMNILNKSKTMMNGYKLDYFLFILSFIGWGLLSVFTLGLALIWVFPYVTVSMALYYEKLKQLKNTQSNTLY